MGRKLSLHFLPLKKALGAGPWLPNPPVAFVESDVAAACQLPLLPIRCLEWLTERCSEWRPALRFLRALFMDGTVTSTELPWTALLPCLWCIYKHLSAKYLINQPFKGAANLVSCQRPSNHKPHFSGTAFSDQVFSWMSFKVIRPCFPEHVVNACGHLF